MIETYLLLFYTFFKIGLFGFGGGYAMLSMIQYDVVNVHGWLTIDEFTDIVAISQMTPGPIAINSATYIGYTATGGSVLGSVIATIAVCLPSLIIMTLICKFFMMFKNNKYIQYAMSCMRPAAIGLIAAAAILLMNKQNFTEPGTMTFYICISIFIITFVLSYFFKWGTIKTIVLAGVLGLLFN